ncbi:MAG: hypothetical protein ABI725_00840 [Chloroflexota bacterium]
MIAIAAELVLVDSRYDLSAACLVCGGLIEAGEGISARYHGRTLRFKCPGCVDRFLAEPERFLSGHGADCCEDHVESPSSEWSD